MTVSADELSAQQQTLMVCTHVSTTDLVSHTYSSEPPEKDITSSDILQQALDEADRYSPTTLARTHRKISHENIHHLTDHSYIHTTKSHLADDEMNTQDIDEDLEASIGKDPKIINNLQFNTNKSIPIQSGDPLTTFPEDVYTIDKSNDVLSMEVGDTVDVLDETALDNSTLVISENPVCSSEKPVVSVSMGALNQQYIFKIKDSPASILSSGNFDISQLKLPQKQTTAPLGSVSSAILKGFLH